MNLCVFGLSGTGKTFLAKALSVECYRKGFRTKFVYFLSLINGLVIQHRADLGKYEKRLYYYARFLVLAVDGWHMGPPKAEEAIIPLRAGQSEIRRDHHDHCFPNVAHQLGQGERQRRVGGSIIGRLRASSYSIDLSGTMDIQQIHKENP